MFVLADGGESFEQQLASYAFVREDREGEVRLHFRDAPAAELAVSFRRSGASLLTLAGQRVRVTPPQDASEGEHFDSGLRRRRAGHEAASVEWGELTVRYFYLLGDMLYTVSIIVPSGVVQSIAAMYPNAALSERELHNRLGVVFVSPQ